MSKWTLRSVPMQNSIYCVRETFSAYRSSCKFPLFCVMWVLRPVFWDMTPCTLLDTPVCGFSGSTPNQQKCAAITLEDTIFYSFLQLRLATSDTTYRPKCFFSKFYINKRIFLSPSNVFSDFFPSKFISVQQKDWNIRIFCLSVTYLCIQF